jgi:hypothetical protein
MRIQLEAHHKEHCQKIGIPSPPDTLDAEYAELEHAKELWDRTRPGSSEAELLTKAIGHLLWARQSQQFPMGIPMPVAVNAPPPLLPFIPRETPGKPELVIPAAKPISHKLEARIIIGLLVMLILLLVSGKAHAQFSRISTVQTTNGGAALGFHASPFVIDCSTNVVCTDDGFTFHITASSTASTAFSSLTAGANSNAGTFSVSGNTWDFSAAVLMKFRVGAGATTSVNGDCAYDSTAKIWHCWQNGADRLMIAATNVGTLGQAFLSGADGSGTFADPVVSGPNAPGTASTANPVQVAGNDGTNVRAIKTDSAGVTQTHETGTATVSGTVAASNFPATVDTNSGVKSASTLRVVLATDQPALTNKLLVTPDSVALPANQSVNVSQLAGTTTDTNSGNKSAGTIRVVLATDQPQLTNAIKVDPSAVTSPVQDTATGATASAVPSRAMQVAGTDGTNLVAPYIDPCQRGAKTYYPVNISTATTVRFAAPTASKKTYICAISLIVGAADNVNIIEGTGGTCGTATAGVTGGTTAASGFNFPANGGIVSGNGGFAVAATAGTNVDTCLITSAAVQLSGHITFVQAP